MSTDAVPMDVGEDSGSEPASPLHRRDAMQPQKGDQMPKWLACLNGEHSYQHSTARDGGARATVQRVCVRGALGRPLARPGCALEKKS
jgi:hypothetical protein